MICAFRVTYSYYVYIVDVAWKSVTFPVLQSAFSSETVRMGLASISTQGYQLLSLAKELIAEYLSSNHLVDCFWELT